MIWFLIFAAGLWGLGHLQKAPVSARLLMIAILYLGVLLAMVILPQDNGLRQTLGGSFGEWALLGGAAVVVWAYRKFLRAARDKAQKTDSKDTPDLFDKAELDRTARHIVLREIGGLGQKKLKESRVLVIGAGGLGSPALQYLAAAGVGTIGVVDDDVVDNSNLQRQVIHTDDRIGMPKVFSAEAAMKAQNPFVVVRPYNRRLGETDAMDLIAEYDLVLDGTDNFETRYLVNKVCVALQKPLIGAALTQWEGQISIYDPAQGAPCYQCVFPQAPASDLAPSCAQAGVLGPLPGVVGSMMAVEAVKEITGAGEGLRGRMMIYDALYGENRTIAMKRNPNCTICGPQ
ncbi:MAG: molybdopterin-synthase adenylyltransferase MoeB [Marinosulfonomonas sp.]